MCFHTKQTKTAKQLENRFKATMSNNTLQQVVASNHFNGFDHPSTPIITNKDPEIIQLYQWGLIPTWSTDDSIKQYTLNARIETLDEKPSFKHHATHRCLILADGFYEWQWLDSKGKQKQKYEIGIQNNELFAFAGIWSEWFNATGELVKTYSIVTTEAQGIMRDIHNSKLRMPIILSPELEKEWLRGNDLHNYIDTGIELVAKTENLQKNLF